MKIGNLVRFNTLTPTDKSVWVRDAVKNRTPFLVVGMPHGIAAEILHPTLQKLWLVNPEFLTVEVTS